MTWFFSKIFPLFHLSSVAVLVCRKCFFALTSSNVKTSEHFMLFLRFAFNQLLLFVIPYWASAPHQLALEKILPRPLWAKLGCLFSFSFSVALKLSSCKQSSAICTFLWSLCSYFQLAYLILSLLVVQNATGEIVAYLCKAGARDTSSPAIYFSESSVLFVLALLFASIHLLLTYFFAWAKWH